jgi:integrase
MTKSDHLWQRGGQWYLRLNIPRTLRHNFLSKTGKPLDRIVEPLGDSKSVAQIEAARRSALYLERFARLKAGESLASIQEDIADERRFQEWIRPGAELRRKHLFEGIASGQIDAERERQDLTRRAQRLLERAAELGGPAAPVPAPQAAPIAETVGQAAEAWFADMQDDVRPNTLADHKRRVRAFTEQCGDRLLADVNKAMASDFLSSLIASGNSQQTRNAYHTTLAVLFESAKDRGRFTGDNPFNGKKRKAKSKSYVPFEDSELQTLFAALPRDVAPKRHTPETAMAWAALIAAYSGARLEEICKLKVADIHDEGANGATVTVIDINDPKKLKNDQSERKVPVHSALVRAGLLKYRDNLPADGPLFPGLKARASKGHKVGARVGELFRKKLEALGLKRDRLCFHSFRRTVGSRLDAAGVKESDVNWILGHGQKTESFGTYSTAPLKRLSGLVEEIKYPDLRL